ncbi:MAG: GNAT family protein [Puia sp.]|nr:GNAT family protein [Puia sp.]
MQNPNGPLNRVAAPAIARAYRIETDRLLIRCYEPADASKLLESIRASVGHLLPWMPWAKREPEDLDAKIEKVRLFRGQFDLGLDYIFAIFDRSGENWLGSTGLHTRIGGNAREIGYWIDARHLKKGYATEAVRALVRIGFAVERLDRIEIHCDPENDKSRRIPERLGFIHEATLKNRFIDADDRRRDKMIWTLFREEYEKTAIAGMSLRAFDIIGRSIAL